MYPFFLQTRFNLLGEDVQRLHEDTEDNDGENPLRRWSTTKGICRYKVTSFQFFSTNLIEKAEV